MYNKSNKKLTIKSAQNNNKTGRILKIENIKSTHSLKGGNKSAYQQAKNLSGKRVFSDPKNVKIVENRGQKAAKNKSSLIEQRLKLIKNYKKSHNESDDLNLNNLLHSSHSNFSSDKGLKNKKSQNAKINSFNNNNFISLDSLSFSSKKIESNNNNTSINKTVNKQKNVNKFINNLKKSPPTSPTSITSPISNHLTTSSIPSYSYKRPLKSSQNEALVLAKQSEIEKKSFEQKIQNVRNRIRALQNQEIELTKKLMLKEEKDKVINEKIKERTKMKKRIRSVNVGKMKEVERMKGLINERKEIEKYNLKLSSLQNQKAKLTDYKKMKEKISEFNRELLEFKEKSLDRNKEIINKIHSQRRDFREKEQRKNEEKIRKFKEQNMSIYDENNRECAALKEELARLEVIERESLEHLRQTQKACIDKMGGDC